MIDKEKEDFDRIESAKMSFCRRMKMPNKGMEDKEGHPYGDIRYSDQDRFSPAGGGEN